MRIECEACHELVDARFAIEGGVAIATCPKCDARNTIRNEPETPKPPPPPKEVCPKCGTPRGEAPACKTCGLAIDKIASYIETRDAAVPEIVHSAWKRAIEEWSERDRHDAVMRVVSASGCFAWAAAKYRDEAAVRGEDAKPYLDRIRMAGEALMYAERTVPKKNGILRGVLIALVSLLVLFALYLGYLLTAHPSTIDDGDPPAGQVR